VGFNLCDSNFVCLAFMSIHKIFQPSSVVVVENYGTVGGPRPAEKQRYFFALLLLFCHMVLFLAASTQCSSGSKSLGI
jgi:hypothetical protein